MEIDKGAVLFVVLLMGGIFLAVAFWNTPILMTQNIFGGSGTVTVTLTNVNATRYIYNGNFAAFINGTDGQRYRTVGLNNTELSRAEIVVVDNYALTPTVDYAVVHQAINSTVQFMNPLWNDQVIMIDFLTTGNLTYTINETTKLGFFMGGTDGNRYRTYTLGGSTANELISIDNFVLIETVDYNATRSSTQTNITFLNPLWDDQYVTFRWYGVVAP
jgi:hypothetical protein